MEPDTDVKWNLPESARIASLLAEIPPPPAIPHRAAPAVPQAAPTAGSTAMPSASVPAAAAEPVAERANPSLGALAAATSAWFSRSDDASPGGAAAPRPAVFGASAVRTPAEPASPTLRAAKPATEADAAFWALPLREALAAVNWRNDPALRRQPEPPPPEDWQENPVEELMRGFVWD